MSAIGRQYARSEHLRLLVANALRRLVQQRLFYLESDLVFAECLQRGATLEREGPTNLIALPDDELGAWEVRLRRRTSDFRVFRQIVLLREYAPVVRLVRLCDLPGPVSTIIDAGSNIGLSAAYFARGFPTARVIALEPDPDNHAAGLENLARCRATNVTVIRKALWSEDVTLELRDDFRDGREWSRSVGRGAGGEPVEGVCLPTLMTEHEIESIDLLKIDIEGAETAVFADAAAERWLPAVHCLVMEIHELKTYAAIAPQLRRHGFLVLDRGELTLAVKKDAISPERLVAYFDSDPGPRDFPIVA